MKRNYIVGVLSLVLVFAVTAALFSGCNLQWRHVDETTEKLETAEEININMGTDIETAMKGVHMADMEPYFMFDKNTGEQGENGGKWIFDDERAIGDKALFIASKEDIDYYSVAVLSKLQYPQRVVNFRHILFMTASSKDFEPLEDSVVVAKEAKCKEIFADWEKSDKSEEYFASLAEKYSEDSESNDDGGLYKAVLPGDMAKELDDWLFTDGRKNGDYGTVETGYGYHIVLFTGEKYEYEAKIAEAIANEKYEAYLDAEINSGKYDVKKLDLTVNNYTSAPALTIGETKVLCCQYSLAYDQSLSQLVQYVKSYNSQNPDVKLSLDISKPLEEQPSPSKDVNGNLMSWAKYIEDYTINAYLKMVILCDAAKVNKVTVSQQEVDEFTAELMERDGYEQDKYEDYLKESFGVGLSDEVFRSYINAELTAEKYYDVKLDELEATVTAQELESKYNEDKDAYDVADLRMYTFGASVQQGSEETEEAYKTRQAAVNERAKQAAIKMLNSVTDEASFLTYADSLSQK